MMADQAHKVCQFGSALILKTFPDGFDSLQLSRQDLSESTHKQSGIPSLDSRFEAK